MKPPIEVLPLFAVLDQHLLDLLRTLSAADWQRPTLARQWTVKDVATHLLDGNLRTLSMLRDGYFGEAPGELTTYEQVVAYLNRLNGAWVAATRHLSPVVLVELLAASGTDYAAFLTTLDPWAPATFAVGWAGETASANWFHVARDYTEKWHHQQQIRQAVGQTALLLTPELFGPFIETLLRGLPHAYRHAAAPVGTVVRVHVRGAGEQAGSIGRTVTGWELLAEGVAATPAAEIELPAHIAWQLFTKGLGPDEARPHAILRGNPALAEPALHLVAVMA